MVRAIAIDGRKTEDKLLQSILLMIMLDELQHRIFSYYINCMVACIAKVWLSIRRQDHIMRIQRNIKYCLRVQDSIHVVLAAILQNIVATIDDGIYIFLRLILIHIRWDLSCQQHYSIYILCRQFLKIFLIGQIH